MDLELKILRSHDATRQNFEPYAYVVWADASGRIEMGPVRAHRTGANGEDMYECSPFPGAWDMYVPESRILRVRHLGAMSI